MHHKRITKWGTSLLSENGRSHDTLKDQYINQMYTRKLTKHIISITQLTAPYYKRSDFQVMPRKPF